MEAVKRGTLGVALFVSGLFAMPAVAALDIRAHETDASLTSADSATVAASPAARIAAAQPPVAVPATLHGFAGVQAGGRITGHVQLRALVTGEVDSVTYTIRDRTSSMIYVSHGSPWLFSPDGAGWDTTRVPNGAYLLIAQPSDHRVPPESISFWVDNSSTATPSTPMSEYASYLP